MATKKYDGPRYAYTAGVGKMADDKFDIKNAEAELRTSYMPDQKAMRYITEDDKLSEFLNPKAGAGRGGQGGPTAKELKKYEDKQDADIYTANKGKPPTDPEMAKKRGGMIKKMASGGGVFRSSANGIAQRGKTKGKMVMMRNGGMC